VNADASDQDIQDLFGGIGAVASKEAVGEGADKLTQDLKVEFSEVEGAQTAVELLQGKSFMGHQLKVTAFTGEAADKGGAAEAEPQVEEAPETSEAETAETEVAEAETSAEEAPSEEPAPVEEAAEAEIRVEEVPSDDQASEGSTPEEEEWSPSAGDKQ
jgi:RNA recognition motif-containing protein